MWLNSMRREEPYLGLTCGVKPWKHGAPSGARTGVAWLSSARAVRCCLKWRNERNPCPMLPAGNAGDSWETAGGKPEEGGDDGESAWPLCSWWLTWTQGRD